MKRVSPFSAVRGSDVLFPNDFEEDLLAICCPSGCTVESSIVDVIVFVVVGVCNCSQMRTSKCTCLIFGVSIDLDPG